MNELVKALSKFINRDIPYVMGGSAVILCFLYLFDIKIPKEFPLPITLLIVGIAYVLGYAIQDGISFTLITNTSMIVTPNKLMKKLFKKWAREDWNVPDDFDSIGVYLALYNDQKIDVLAPIERIIFLKHIGTTMGASFLVCTILLGIKSVSQPTALNISISTVTLIFSILLIFLGWLQVMQLNSTLYKLSSNNGKAEQGIKWDGY